MLLSPVFDRASSFCVQVLSVLGTGLSRVIQEHIQGGVSPAGQVISGGEQFSARNACHRSITSALPLPGMNYIETLLRTV